MSPSNSPGRSKSTKQSGFRILGDELDRDESYLDVSVDGVDGDGKIYLKAQDGETWELTAEQLGTLYQDLLLVGQDNIPKPNHDIWKNLDRLEKTRKNTNINNFVDENLQKAQRNLFKSILEAGR